MAFNQDGRKKSVFGNVFGKLHEAGSAFRNLSEVVAEVAGQLRGQASVAGKVVQAGSDNARELVTAIQLDGDLHDQFGDVKERVERGAVWATAWLRGIVGVSAQVMKGMRPEVAEMLLHLRTLQTLAAARSAESLEEVIAAAQHYQDIATRAEADKEVELSSDIEALKAKLSLARQAVERVPTTERAVRDLQLQLQISTGELKSIFIDRDQKSAKYITQFRATSSPQLVDQSVLSELLTALNELVQKIRGGQPISFAVALSGLDSRVMQIEKSLKAEVEFFEHRARSYLNAQNYLLNRVQRAKDLGLDENEELRAFAQQALAALRASPANVDEAVTHINSYSQLTEQLQNPKR